MILIHPARPYFADRSNGSTARGFIQIESVKSVVKIPGALVRL